MGDKPTIVRPFDVMPETEAVRLLASAVAPGLDVSKAKLVVEIARHLGLDPLARQLYAWEDRGRLVLHVSIHGLRARAIASGQYAGTVGPQWCGPEGRWHDVWLADEPPAAARVGVRRKDAPEPIWGIATWKEFGAPRDEARRRDRNGREYWAYPVWREKPAHMLAIRAEYHALLRAFPELAQMLEASQAQVELSDMARVVHESAPAIEAGGEPEPADSLGDEGVEVVAHAEADVAPPPAVESEEAREQKPEAAPEPAPASEAPQKPDWSGWRDDDKTRLLAAMKSAGVTVRELLEAFGVEGDARTWPQALLPLVQSDGVEVLTSYLEGIVGETGE